MKKIFLRSMPVLLVSMMASPVDAQYNVPDKLVSASGGTYLIRQDNNGEAPPDVQYVYRGKVRDPQSKKLYDREYWFKDAPNNQLTGSFKEQGDGETCYALATLNMQNFSMEFTYFPQSDNHQSCSIAGQTFSTQLSQRPLNATEPPSRPSYKNGQSNYNATVQSDTITYRTPDNDSFAAFSLQGDERVIWMEERAVGRDIWFRVEVLRDGVWKSGWLKSIHVDRD